MITEISLLRKEQSWLMAKSSNVLVKFLVHKLEKATRGARFNPLVKHEGKKQQLTCALHE